MSGFLFPSWALEFGIHGALTLASTLLTAKSAQNGHRLFWRSLFLAVVGFVVSMFFAYLFDASWIPVAIGSFVWIVRAVASSTDPVGSALLSMFMSAMLDEKSKEGTHTSAKESVLNDVIASAVLGGLLYQSLELGIGGAVAGLVIAAAAGFLSTVAKSEYGKVAIVWLCGVVTMAINLVLHGAGVHFEIAALTVTGFGGVFAVVFGGVQEEQKHLDVMEFAVMIVVSGMCLWNAWGIANLNPEMANAGGPYMMTLRISRAPYALMGILGITTAFGGIPGIAVINLSATRLYEAGNIDVAAFLAGTSVWSVVFGIPLAMALILATSWWHRRKQLD